MTSDVELNSDTVLKNLKLIPLLCRIGENGDIYFGTGRYSVQELREILDIVDPPADKPLIILSNGAVE